jgi:hypothetical protein
MPAACAPRSRRSSGPRPSPCWPASFPSPGGSRARRVNEQEAETATGTLSSVLQAAGSTEDDTSGIAAAAALADSLREAGAHVRGAAKAVEEGTLRRAVAKARKQLHEDLDGLLSVVSGADEATDDWRRERKSVLADLRREVDTKLDRLERVGAWLEQVAPRLQLAGRVLHHLLPRAHDLVPRGTVTFTDTVGHTYGPFAVSLAH